MFLSKQKLIQETSIVIEKIVLLYPSTLSLLGNCRITVFDYKRHNDIICIDLYMVALSTVMTWAWIPHLVKTSHTEKDISMCCLDPQ